MVYPTRSRTRSYRPQLDRLEERLAPGEAFLGLALGSLFGSDSSVPVAEDASTTTGTSAASVGAAAPLTNWLPTAAPVPEGRRATNAPATATPTAPVAFAEGIGTDLTRMDVTPVATPARPVRDAELSVVASSAAAATFAAGGVLQGGTWLPATLPVALPAQRGGEGELLQAFAARKDGGQNPGGPEGTNVYVGPNVLTHSRESCTPTTGKIQSETAIAISGNAVVVGYNDFRAFYCPGTPHRWQVTGWAYSLDYGETFTDGGPLPGGASLRGDPWLATGPDGTIYFASLWNGLSNLAILRGTVTDTGISWSNPVILPASGGQFDKEAMTVDPFTGDVYVTYTRFGGPGGIWLYRSGDGARTFEGPFAVRSGSSPQLQGSYPATGPFGEVYIAYNMGYPGTFGMGFAVSWDFGRTFYLQDQIANVTNFTIPGHNRGTNTNFPQMAVDLSGGPNTGTIYIAYATSNTGTNGDAMLIKSTDGGFSWSTPLRVNDDSTTGHQFFPTVDVDYAGNVHVFFYDRRLNPGSTLTDVYYARSTDAGASFEANVRITEVTSNWNFNGDGAPNYGDYIKATIADVNWAFVSYADSRDGDPDTYSTWVYVEDV